MGGSTVYLCGVLWILYAKLVFSNWDISFLLILSPTITKWKIWMRHINWANYTRGAGQDFGAP